MNFPSATSRAVTMFLHQAGHECDVYVEDRKDSDVLNHPVEEFKYVGTTLAIRHYGGATDEERDYGSGRRVKETPYFVFPIDTIAENNCHILYAGRKGEEYEITAMTNRETHFEANGKARQEGSVLDDINE